MAAHVQLGSCVHGCGTKAAGEKAVCMECLPVQSPSPAAAADELSRHGLYGLSISLGGEIGMRSMAELNCVCWVLLVAEVLSHTWTFMMTQL